MDFHLFSGLPGVKEAKPKAWAGYQIHTRPVSQQGLPHKWKGCVFKVSKRETFTRDVVFFMEA
jgi:hypothetical protein